MRQVAFFSILACLLAATPASAQQTRAKYPPDLQALRLLVDAPGIAGFETAVRDAVSLPAWATRRVDEAGNLMVTLGEGSPHVLVCADMDEDGYFVSAITEEGYLRVHRVTTGVTNRLFEQMHYGQPISVLTQTGTPVPGVFVTASTHLQRGRQQGATPMGLDDLWIDVGASSASDVSRLGIRILDPVSLRERSQVLHGGRFAGVAAQTRAGDLALSMLLESPGPLSPRVGSLTIAWTAQGTFGGRGMARLAQQIAADRVIVVARTPMPRDGNNPKGVVGQLGRGPLVAAGDEETIALAKKIDVAVQPVAGALRAPQAWPAGKTTLIGLPVAYAQTPVEVVDLEDVSAAVDLLAGLTGLSPVSAHVENPVAKAPSDSAGLPAILGPLVRVQGVSGAEGPVAKEIARQLPSWARPETDQRGNVTVSFGSGGRQLVFVAHMDEIGYQIVNVLDDGTASVRKLGGFFDYLWEAHPVLVQTAKGLVPAIAAPRPGYLRSGAAAPGNGEIVLYFGTDSAEATQALGVARGDTATIRKALTPLAGSRWTARSMDDRCGVAALIAALKQIDPAKVPNRVTFAFVVGEETGLVGSGFLAERVHPAAVFAIDTFVSSDSPVDPQRLALVPLGSGVVARAIDNSSITPPDVVARVMSIGRSHGIPVTPSTTSGGNDGSQFGKYGSAVVPLSWPGRYSHSPVEVMDIRDLYNLVGLVIALTNEY
jgi:putative aminopeptidase FrvX